jgi:hypothetical protein
MLLATAGTAATLFTRDRAQPAANEIVAAAPWRLEISSPPESRGCTVTVTASDTDTDYRRVFANVWGTQRFQVPRAGTFRWQADDPSCVVLRRSGSGKAVLPFSQKAGTGDSDVFEAPDAPGTVAVHVLTFDGYKQCGFELRDAADGQLVATDTVQAPAKDLRLDPDGRSQVYLAAFSGCTVRISAEP